MFSKAGKTSIVNSIDKAACDSTTSYIFFLIIRYTWSECLCVHTWRNRRTDTPSLPKRPQPKTLILSLFPSFPFHHEHLTGWCLHSVQKSHMPMYTHMTLLFSCAHCNTICGRSVCLAILRGTVRKFSVVCTTPCTSPPLPSWSIIFSLKRTCAWRERVLLSSVDISNPHYFESKALSFMQPKSHDNSCPQNTAYILT